MKSLAFAAIIVLSACSSKAPPAAEPTPAPADPSTPVSSEETACQTADDCVVVETECCDHCNGGKALAFHKDHAQSHAVDPASCAAVSCTMMACGPALPACEAGVCTVTIGALE